MNQLTRRGAIQTIGAIGASMTLPLSTFGQTRLSKKIKLGMIADLHGGLAKDADSRLDAFIQAMSNENCNALAQLGDFAYPNSKHQSYPKKINAAHKTVLHVIGNHEFDFRLTRKDCYRAWGIKNSYYRSDIGDLRILVLDGNDRGSPTHRGGYPSYIGDKQKSWLDGELKSSEKPIMILSHQPLAGRSAINNASAIQKILSKYKAKIILCLNGHSHLDSLVQVGGVSYLHINSASYFWVGGKTRMAYYTDPLYSTVTIDPAAATVSIVGKSSKWKDKSPKELGYFDRKNAPSEKIVTPQIRSRKISAKKSAEKDKN